MCAPSSVVVRQQHRLARFRPSQPEQHPTQPHQHPELSHIHFKNSNTHVEHHRCRCQQSLFSLATPQRAIAARWIGDGRFTWNRRDSPTFDDLFSCSCCAHGHKRCRGRDDRGNFKHFFQDRGQALRCLLYRLGVGTRGGFKRTPNDSLLRWTCCTSSECRATHHDSTTSSVYMDAASSRT